VVFVETSVFTDAVLEALTDEEYRALQTSLMVRPSQGAVMPGTGGLRKMRWGAAGRGKRGGVRAIYYWDEAHDRVYLLLIYRKAAQDDLTPAQLKVVKRLVREEFK
jgi:mRNA-degrading endonuclease RelE of RelBE toxin-antitoxin system